MLSNPTEYKGLLYLIPSFPTSATAEKHANKQLNLTTPKEDLGQVDWHTVGEHCWGIGLDRGIDLGVGSRMGRSGMGEVPSCKGLIGEAPTGRGQVWEQVHQRRRRMRDRLGSRRDRLRHRRLLGRQQLLRLQCL